MPSEKTRQRLIAEATIAFLADGYGAASLDRIAKAAKISKKTIYQHVGSKAELFIAVVENALTAIPAGGLVADVDHADPEMALRDFLRACAALGLSEAGLRFYWMIVREAGNFPELIPAFRQALSGFTSDLVGWIEAQNRRGWLAAADPQRAASALMTLLLEERRSGFALGLLPPPAPAEQAALVDCTLDLFLNGTRSRQHDG